MPLAQGHWLVSVGVGVGGENLQPVGSPFGIQRRLQPWESQAGLAVSLAAQGQSVRVPHGVAGWHFAAGCLQPWAAATGLVPAQPRASFENSSEAQAPCSRSPAVPANIPAGRLLCAPSAC